MATELHADDEVRFHFTVSGTYSGRRGHYGPADSDALLTDEQMALQDGDDFNAGRFSAEDLLSWADDELSFSVVSRHGD